MPSDCRAVSPARRGSVKINAWQERVAKRQREAGVTDNASRSGALSPEPDGETSIDELDAIRKTWETDRHAVRKICERWNGEITTVQKILRQELDAILSTIATEYVDGAMEDLARWRTEDADAASKPIDGEGQNEAAERSTTANQNVALHDRQSRDCEQEVGSDDHSTCEHSQPQERSHDIPAFETHRQRILSTVCIHLSLSPVPSHVFNHENVGPLDSV
jgi:hypothetical protein